MSAWLAMGGQGRYVWGSVGVVLLAMAVEAVLLARRRRRALDDVDALDAEDAA